MVVAVVVRSTLAVDREAPSSIAGAEEPWSWALRFPPVVRTNPVADRLRPL